MRLSRLVLGLVILAGNQAFADEADTTPRLYLGHHGRLLGADNKGVDGAQKFKIRFYSEGVAGASTDKMLWEETYDVTLDGGSYSLVIGGLGLNGAAKKELRLSTFAGRDATYMTVTLENGTELLPRMTVGRVPLAGAAETAKEADHAKAADTATKADGVSWTGGTVALNSAGKWPASALEVPAGLVTVGSDGKIPDAQLAANVARLDNGKLPLSALPSGPSGLDSASVGGHTTADASSGDQKIPLLEGGKLAVTNIPASVVQTGGDGKVAVGVLPASVVQTGSDGKIAAGILPASVAQIGGDGKISPSQLPTNVALLAGDATFGALSAGSLNVGGAAAQKAKLEVKGALRIGDANEVCDATTNGMLRFKNERLEICAVSTWQLVAAAPATALNLVDASGSRRWSDGTFAKSCKEYRTPTAPYIYSGATGTGLYTIRPAGGTSQTYVTYCDMETDGGGWTLTLKWKSGPSNQSYYFNQHNMNSDIAFTALNQTPSGATEGFSSATRQIMWAQSGANTYRMTVYNAAAQITADVKKSTNLDTGNVSFCAASGCTGASGYGNATVGTMTNIGGGQGSVGTISTLYQLGEWNCNCSEAQYFDNYTSGFKIFGDYSQENGGVVSTLFWIR